MRIAGAANGLARSFLVFLIAYLWLSFYVENILMVFCVAFAVMCGVNFAFGMWAKRRSARAAMTRKQQEHLRNVELQLKFQSRMRNIGLLRIALEKRGYRVTTTQRKLSVATNNKIINMYPIFDRAVTTADVVSCVKYTNKNAVTYIAATRFDAEVVAFARSLDCEIVLMDIASVYAEILCPAEIFPNVAVRYKSKARLTMGELGRAMFNRTKVRGYVFIGIVVLATSFIVNFPIYYIVCASVLFLFALMSMFHVQLKDAI